MLCFHSSYDILMVFQYNPPPAMKVPPSTPKYAYGKVQMKVLYNKDNMYMQCLRHGLFTDVVYLLYKLLLTLFNVFQSLIVPAQ